MACRKDDITTTVEELKEMVKRFCEIRDWNKYHNPKNLAIGIITEAAELLEIFRWKNQQESCKLFKVLKHRNQIEEEVADIFYFLLRFAQMNNIDLTKALIKKLKINERRYPVEKIKGLAKKYTEIQYE